MLIYRDQRQVASVIAGQLLTEFVPNGQKMNYQQYTHILNHMKSKLEFMTEDTRVMYLEYMSYGTMNGIGISVQSKGVEAIPLDSDLLNIPEANDCILPRTIFNHLFKLYFSNIDISPLKLDYLYYRHLKNILGSDLEIRKLGKYLNGLDKFNINYEVALQDVRNAFNLGIINLDNISPADAFRMSLAADHLVSKYRVNNRVAQNMVTMCCGDYRSQRIATFRTPIYGYFNTECVRVTTTSSVDFISYLNMYKGANLNGGSTASHSSGISRLV